MSKNIKNKLFIVLIIAMLSVIGLLFDLKLPLYLLAAIIVLLLGRLLFKKFPKLQNPDFLFIILFFSIILIPVIKIDNSKVSKIENRALAVFPTKFNHKFGTNFDAWFNDRFFGRENILKLHDMTKAFDTKIETDKAFMGKDNWLFYKENNSILNYTNAKTMSEKSMKKISEYLSDINDWCEQHGKRFYFVIAPDKNKVYSEYYPDHIGKERPDEYGLGNEVARYITENTDVNVIYLYDELMQAKEKSDKLLYYKHDTHWNYFGAYIGFQYIYKIITGTDWDDEKYIKSWRTETNRGDLPPMLGYIGRNMKDIATYMVPDFYNRIKLTQKTFKNNAEGITESTNPDANGRIFVLRDSFSNLLKNYFAQSFNKVTMYWTYQIDSNMLNQIDKNYDVVILEVVERFIPNLDNLEFPKD